MSAAAPIAPPELLPLGRCRLCGSSHLNTVVDLGLRHMVDFPETADGMTKPPLPLLVRQCRSCTLVQLAHTAPADWRYSTYYYRSGTNETMRDELADVVSTVKSVVAIGRGSTVLDIGANDGTLLAAYEAGGATPIRIGVEPAQNLQASLEQQCDLALQKTWPLPEAGSPRYTPLLPSASITAVTSIAMIYGADDLHAFTAEVKRVLHPDGVWVVQFQDLLSGIRTNAFDYLVHEHLCWFSLWSFAQLLHRHDLTIVDVEPRAINGGSLRVVVRHRGIGRPTARVTAQIEQEREAGLLQAGGGLGSFLARMALIQTAVRSMVERVIAGGGTVDLYAASTKATLLLQLCGLDARHIRQAVERQPQKWGRYVGASGIPIVNEEAMRYHPPTALLLGAYQFRDAFVEREHEYLEQGGVMICPLPVPEVIRMGRLAE